MFSFLHLEPSSRAFEAERGRELLQGEPLQEPVGALHRPAGALSVVPKKVLKGKLMSSFYKDIFLNTWGKFPQLPPPCLWDLSVGGHWRHSSAFLLLHDRCYWRSARMRTRVVVSRIWRDASRMLGDISRLKRRLAALCPRWGWGRLLDTWLRPDCRRSAGERDLFFKKRLLFIDWFLLGWFIFMRNIDAI